MANVSMSPEQLQQLVSSLTTAAIQATTDMKTATSSTSSFSNASFSYDGTRDHARVEEFLSSAIVYKDVNNISNANALKSLPLVLKGDASTWWLGVKEGITKWDEFEKRLRHAFAPKKTGVMIFQELFSQKQPANMLTETFVAKCRALLSQLPAPGMTEELQLDAVYGQLHVNIRKKVQRDSCDSFDQLLNAARNVEQLLREEAMPTASAVQDKPKKKRCEFCRGLGHTTEECRKRQKQMTSQQPAPVLKVKSEIASTQFPSPSRPVFECYGCGAPGVTRAKCPTCRSAQLIKSEKVDFCAINIQTDARPRPMVAIGIGDVTGTAFIDTCAKSSVASYQLYECLKREKYQFARQTVTVTMADGVKRRQDILSVSVPIKICNRIVKTNLIVLPESRENKTLLGVGFIEDAGMVINVPQRTFHFVDRPMIQFDLAIEEVEGVTLAQFEPSSHAVAPRSVMTASSVPSSLVNPVIAPKEMRSTIGPQIVEPKKAQAAEHVIPHKRPRQMFDGYVPDYTDFMFADAVRVVEEAEIDLSPRSLALFSARIDNDVSLNSLDLVELKTELLEETEKKRLYMILAENEAVCLPSRNPTTLIEHSIDTRDHPPIAVPPYRLSPIRKEQLKKEIEKMLDERIIEPSSSPWTAPMILVPKKDGSVRPCVDYRRLNSITVPDVYPIPRVDDLLRDAKPTSFMTTLDLRAGYWQVKVRDKDQDKTSFITPLGVYKFIRMPFGLRNAPSTFQRLIDRVKVMAGDIKMLAYLDDIIILSTSFEKHLEDLEKVLRILKDNNLTINLAKCNFCCESVKYLGHIITPQGLRTDPAKVAAIADLPRPRNLKHLLSFIQTCSWYRRFIPNFSQISEPLTRLTKKKAQWEWNEAQENAFHKLKTCLTTSPVLKPADETQAYTIKTDASSYAIGAVLVQGEGEKEHPIEYASRLLIPAERNYSTTEREALAVVWALNKFRGYVEGVEVTVVTDHQALKWLMSIKTPTGRLARWTLLIQAFNVTIKYAPGKTNKVADSLSRPHCDDKTSNECGVCSVVIDIPTRSAAEIRKEQMNDNYIARIVKALESGVAEDAIYWSGKGYLLNNGLLYKYDPDGSGENAQLLVPEHEWKNVLSAYHDHPLAGHYGAEKTLQCISKRYYWKGMRKFVESYVKSCLMCQRYKPTNLKPAGLLQTTATNQRFECLSFDLFGPLPTTETQKNWILIVEDIATGWIELFALETADAETCATTLINEVFLRYGMPRRIHSDNGPQFVSSVMQKMIYCLDIKHTFTPVYHPAANPVERKNRDLKTQLAILVQDDHRNWSEKLACIRFAMNTASSSVTGHTPAYLTFARELRTPDDVNHDLKQIALSENFVAEITPKLLLIADTLKRSKEIRAEKEEARKEQADKTRRPDPGYEPGDLVLANVHAVSKTAKGISNKFVPRRDGPYVIESRQGATTYKLAMPDDPTNTLGSYHTSALTPYKGDAKQLPKPHQPIRKRGRPKKTAVTQPSTSTERRRRGRPKKSN